MWHTHIPWTFSEPTRPAVWSSLLSSTRSEFPSFPTERCSLWIPISLSFPVQGKAWGLQGRADTTCASLGPRGAARGRSRGRLELVALLSHASLSHTSWVSTAVSHPTTWCQTHSPACDSPWSPGAFRITQELLPGAVPEFACSVMRLRASVC